MYMLLHSHNFCYWIARCDENQKTKKKKRSISKQHALINICFADFSFYYDRIIFFYISS